MHLYIWIKSWGGWEEILFPAAQYFPIFVFVIFRRVGNFDVRRDSNVHRDTLVRSWLSLTDRQTNVRLENFSKLNWTKHSRGDITFSACNCTYFKALLFKFWLEGKNNSLSTVVRVQLMNSNHCPPITIWRRMLLCKSWHAHNVRYIHL